MAEPVMKEGGRGYETRDAALRPLVIFLVGLAVLCAVALVAMAVLFRVLDARTKAGHRPPSPLADTRSPTPDPLLQSTPRIDLEAFAEEQDAALHHYAWVDEQAGIARIPIERAKDLALARGFPTEPSADAPEPEAEEAPGVPTPSESP